MNVAASPQAPPNAIQNAGAARLPVSLISQVEISGVKPPNKAVASE